MARARIKLPDGTIVDVEGSIDEIEQLMSSERTKGSQEPNEGSSSEGKKQEEDQIQALVNTLKESNFFNQIQKRILDKAKNVNKVLLPLFIAAYYFKDRKILLTPTGIQQFLIEFSTYIRVDVISDILRGKRSGGAHYVIANKRWSRNARISYTISKPGLNYYMTVIGE